MTLSFGPFTKFFMHPLFHSLQNRKAYLLKGTFLLGAAGILCKIAGFFYKIFLSRTIGAEALGIYQLIFPLFAFCLALSCGGLQTAISRYAASSKTDRIARSYLTIGTTLSLVLSFCCVTCTVVMRGSVSVAPSGARSVSFGPGVMVGTFDIASPL